MEKILPSVEGSEVVSQFPVNKERAIVRKSERSATVGGTNGSKWLTMQLTSSSRVFASVQLNGLEEDKSKPNAPVLVAEIVVPPDVAEAHDVLGLVGGVGGGDGGEDGGRGDERDE